MTRPLIAAPPGTAATCPDNGARIAGSICAIHVPGPPRTADTTATWSSSCRTTAFCSTDGILHQEAVTKLESQCSNGGIPDAVLSHLGSSLQRPVPNWSAKVNLQENIGAETATHANLLRRRSVQILFSSTVRNISICGMKSLLKHSSDECESRTGAVQILPDGGVDFANADRGFAPRSGP